MAVKVKKRSGKWWVYIDHKGRRKAKCIGDKRTAERVAETIRAKLVLGDMGVVRRERRPFGAYYRAWLETYVATHCKRSTYDGYEATGRLYLIPAFGEKDLAEITRDDVKALAYAMLREKGLARATVKANLAPLREVFNHAMDDGHVTANPAVRVLGRSRADEKTRRPPEEDFLTREEVGQLLGACREHFPTWHPFVLLLARTGVRLGEALGLEWGDIDLGGRFAVIRRSVVEGRVETPKSGRTRRIDLSAQLVEALRGLSVGNGAKRRSRRGRRSQNGSFLGWTQTTSAGGSGYASSPGPSCGGSASRPSVTPSPRS